MGRIQDGYELSPHRFRELRHFCLQYPEWKIEYEKLCYPEYGDAQNDITAEVAVLLAEYSRVITLVEMTARDCGMSMDDVLVCSCRDARRFYWLLSERKGL